MDQFDAFQATVLGVARIEEPSHQLPVRPVQNLGYTSPIAEAHHLIVTVDVAEVASILVQVRLVLVLGSIHFQEPHVEVPVWVVVCLQRQRVLRLLEVLSWSRLAALAFLDVLKLLNLLTDVSLKLVQVLSMTR